MSDSSRRKKRPSPRTGRKEEPFFVTGLNVVVQMRRVEEGPVQVHCPRGQPIQYGEVVAVGDGFDPDAESFREMPPIGSVVVFEETTEGVEGHYFYMDDVEYRVLHVDAINIAFPPGSES